MQTKVLSLSYLHGLPVLVTKTILTNIINLHSTSNSAFKLTWYETWGSKSWCLFLCLCSLLPDQHYNHAGPQGHSTVLDSLLMDDHPQANHLAGGSGPQFPLQKKNSYVCTHAYGKGGYWILLNLYDSNLKVLQHFIDNLESSKHTQAAHVIYPESQ